MEKVSGMPNNNKYQIDSRSRFPHAWRTILSKSSPVAASTTPRKDAKTTRKAAEALRVGQQPIEVENPARTLCFTIAHSAESFSRPGTHWTGIKLR